VNEVTAAYNNGYSAGQKDCREKMEEVMATCNQHHHEVWNSTECSVCKREWCIEELEADKKELLRTIENLEDRIRCKEKEINAANKLATQRGARMQIMWRFMETEVSKVLSYDRVVDAFLWHNFGCSKWFDADGVPVREEK
jgi:hypothetical protein